jgi:antitoxin component YwqK of YwqJK toxin-antitoxin module
MNVNEKVYLAQVAPRTRSEVKNSALNDLTNICVAQLEQEKANEQKTLKRSASCDKENPSDSKIRKIETVQKLVVHYKSGSSAEFTVDENNIPNGKALYTSHDGTLMHYSNKNGVKHGSATRYYPDGAVETLLYNNGIKDGPSTYIHNNVILAGTCVNNVLEGKVTKTTLSTGTITEALYKNGSPTEFEKTTYKNGDVLTRQGSLATFKFKK